MEVIEGLERGNQILGEMPSLLKSRITFIGTDNILFCEAGVRLENSILTFKGNGSVIYLGENIYSYRMIVDVFNDNVFHIGKHNFINRNLHVIVSEGHHVFIGDHGNFSLNVYIRNADAHLIYDSISRKRINQTKSIFIGDHVWVGQDSLILKGTKIDSGSIIGAKSVISGKKIGCNSVWAGNPGKKIKDQIFWDQTNVHAFRENETTESLQYDFFLKRYDPDKTADQWLYEYHAPESIDFDEINHNLTVHKSSQSKLDYLIRLNAVVTKNRFVHEM